MNRKQFVVIVCLGALIVSPTLALLAMQMPLWLPPKPTVLNSIPYVDFDPAWDNLGTSLYPSE